MNFLTRLFEKKEFRLLPEHFYYNMFNNNTYLFNTYIKDSHTRWVKYVFEKRIKDFIKDDLIIGKTIITENFTYSNGLITKNDTCKIVDHTISDPITLMNCDKELDLARKNIINEWSKQQILGQPKHSKDANGNCVFNGKIIKTIGEQDEHNRN